jgi:hypothetical protein
LESIKFGDKTDKVKFDKLNQSKRLKGGKRIKSRKKSDDKEAYQIKTKAFTNTFKFLSSINTSI